MNFLFIKVSWFCFCFHTNIKILILILINDAENSALPSITIKVCTSFIVIIFQYSYFYFILIKYIQQKKKAFFEQYYILFYKNLNGPNSSVCVNTVYISTNIMLLILTELYRSMLTLQASTLILIWIFWDMDQREIAS